jgi:hypothetical protein
MSSSANVHLQHSALLQAAQGRKEVVEYLVQKGANMEVVDGDGYTVLYRALVEEENDVARVLLDAGANVSITVGMCNTQEHGVCWPKLSLWRATAWRKRAISYVVEMWYLTRTADGEVAADFATDPSLKAAIIAAQSRL